MNKNSRIKAGRRWLLASAFAGVTTASQAATVAFYDFDNAGAFSNSVDTKAVEVLSATGWTLSNGDSVLNATGAGSGSRAADALWTSTQFMEFSFTIDPGFKLDLTGLSFVERFGGGSNGGGPQRAFYGWNFLVNGLERTGGAAVLDVDTKSSAGNSDSFKAAVLDTPLLVTGLTGTVNIRFTGDAPFNEFAQGSWRFDNFTLSGDFSPVPVPGAVWLMGSAVIALAAQRRRRG